VQIGVRDSETLFKGRSPALAAAPAFITSLGYLGRGSSGVLELDVADCAAATDSRSRPNYSSNLKLMSYSISVTVISGTAVEER
jgi:hypothetical protein